MAIGAESDHHLWPSSRCSCCVAPRSIAHGMGQLPQLHLRTVAAMRSLRTDGYVGSSSEDGTQVHCHPMVEGHHVFVWEPAIKPKDVQTNHPLQPGHPHLAPPWSGELAAAPHPTPLLTGARTPAQPRPPGLLGPPSQPEQQTKNTY